MLNEIPMIVEPGKAVGYRQFLQPFILFMEILVNIFFYKSILKAGIQFNIGKGLMDVIKGPGF